jgi:hypothetical protein
MKERKEEIKIFRHGENLTFRMSDKYDVIYLLTAVGLTPGGSSTVHITHKKYTEQHNETDYISITIRIHNLQN